MKSNHPLTIYISAAADLMAERETLARTIAELPVTLAWHIFQSPIKADPIDLDALNQADFYFIIMGADIRAPVGFELNVARRAHRPMIGFARRGVSYTPAGQVFRQEAQHLLPWHLFSNTADLSRQVRWVIVEHLLTYAIRYALTPQEVIELKDLLKADVSAAPTPEAEGTGHSAVLLSRERYTPSGGTIVDGEASES